MIETV